MSIICKGFKTKIYPNKKQEEYFNKCFGIARFAYNWFLNTKFNYLDLKIMKSFYNIRKEFTDLRYKEFPFVLEVNSRVYGYGLGDADMAFKKYFKEKTGRPKYKSKKDNKQSFSTNRCKILSRNLFHISENSRKPNQYNFLQYGYQIKTSEDISFLQNKNIFQ